MKRQPDRVQIVEVAVDSTGRVVVTPAPSAEANFGLIYRAAMEVAWNPETKSLVGGQPREWTMPRWFKQIADAVASEYGVTLFVAPITKWTNVSEQDRREIEACSRQA